MLASFAASRIGCHMTAALILIALLPLKAQELSSQGKCGWVAADDMALHFQLVAGNKWATDVEIWFSLWTVLVRQMPAPELMILTLGTATHITVQFLLSLQTM